MALAAVDVVAAGDFPPASMRRLPLAAALIFSLGLHAAGLMLFMPRPTDLEAEQGGAILVTLVSAALPEQASRGAPTEEPEPLFEEQPSLLPPPEPVSETKAAAEMPVLEAAAIELPPPSFALDAEPPPITPPPEPVTLPPQPFALDTSTAPFVPMPEPATSKVEEAAEEPAEPVAAHEPARTEIMEAPEDVREPTTDPVVTASLPEARLVQPPAPADIALPRPRPANAPKPPKATKPPAKSSSGAGQTGSSSASLAGAISTGAENKAPSPGNAAVSSYPGKIAKKLRSATRYPAAARAKRLSGKVMVSFTILADGQVKGVRLATSSGEKILDDAAIATVNRAAPFPPIPDGRANWAFTVPIAFKR